ncbi:uncharacterized protein EV422DRAFT_549968 [Fimicolochytrium jonesii]|uniref:uncharacterized protein n=1 Tax=Fimicolochytrium jonesii TaxID=1396493 RepID=UPI0022FEDA6D|nr:uncharacterized protein EV422DRAFT_549968 [Fimicolochytrium jonesii]KAI8824009.1 hypothetical protein EV422DRAFT_549968 [Fimicolochytrium jonesii]
MKANPPPTLRSIPLLLLTTTVLLLLLPPAFAHSHPDPSTLDPAQQANTPIDNILYLHMMVQVIAWGGLFPLGMVLGIVRSRWHVPVQVGATVLTIGGYILGHSHKGRQFPHTAHGSFASLLAVCLAAQVSLGLYLKLHIHEGTRFRRLIVITHGILGKSWPILAWTQILLGVVASLGFCTGEHLGQCLAHLIMGSAFIAYGSLLVLMLRVGSAWLARQNKSQEFIDSFVLMVWGIVNTFTEHGWGTPWSHKDMQHTSMGIVWWASGALSLFLSRNGRRSIFPGIILIFTGYSFFTHAQSLEFSAKLHAAFGGTLMLAGLTRVIEISFILRDAPADSANVRSFQHIPPFLLTVSGTMFMTVTEEQLALINGIGVDHSTYILLQITIASLTYLWVNALISVYSTSGRNAAPMSANPLLPKTESSRPRNPNNAGDGGVYQPLQTPSSSDEDEETISDDDSILDAKGKGRGANRGVAGYDEDVQLRRM